MSPEHLRLRLPLAARVRGVRLLARGAAAVQGELAARAAGQRAALEAATARLEAAAERVERQAEAARAQLARAGTELGLEIARTLLRAEVARGHYDLEKLVRETLAQSGVGRGACVVHLNPADHARLADVRFRSGTRLEPDPGVAQGDVHVETALGVLVRDLDAALEAIAERLREEHA